ncbi:protein of unknown function (plasmid) [Shinella sp. WSC3-e]|nr:protein of unknown function [Shinella sp. WSC3-e]
MKAKQPTQTPTSAATRQHDIAIPLFGYKNHDGIDRAHGFIRGWAVTSADDLLQPRILVLELQLLHLRRQHASVFFLPVEIGRLTDPRFPEISATETPSSPCFRMNAF